MLQFCGEYTGFSGFTQGLTYFHHMSDGIQSFHVKRSLFSAPRLLTIAPLYLEIEGSLANTRFTKEDIEGLRFGVTALRYYVIPISKTYNIEIKSSQGKIILIRMHSFSVLEISRTAISLFRYTNRFSSFISMTWPFTMCDY